MKRLKGCPSERAKDFDGGRILPDSSPKCGVNYTLLKKPINIARSKLAHLSDVQLVQVHCKVELVVGIRRHLKRLLGETPGLQELGNAAKQTKEGVRRDSLRTSLEADAG